jgi:hypothetical protein
VNPEANLLLNPSLLSAAVIHKISPSKARTYKTFKVYSLTKAVQSHPQVFSLLQFPVQTPATITKVPTSRSPQVDHLPPASQLPREQQNQSLAALLPANRLVDQSQPRASSAPCRTSSVDQIHKQRTTILPRNRQRRRSCLRPQSPRLMANRGLQLAAVSL